MATVCVGDGLEVVGGLLKLGPHVPFEVQATTKIVGPAIPAGALDQPFIQCGSFVDTTTGLGALIVPYPVPFPNRVVMVVACNGDTDAGSAEMIGVDHSEDTLSQFVVRFYDHDGSISAGTMRRVNWIAIGN